MHTKNSWHTHIHTNCSESDVYTNTGYKKYKIFGSYAVEAKIKELKQLDNGDMPRKRAIATIETFTLAADVKAKSSDAVNLIKVKRDSDIKFRACAKGSK